MILSNTNGAKICIGETALHELIKVAEDVLESLKQAQFMSDDWVDLLKGSPWPVIDRLDTALRKIKEEA